MVSNISASSLASAYNLSSTKNIIGSTNEASSASADIVDEYIPSSVGASIKTSSSDDASEPLAGELKKATSGMSACSGCGALYMGESPPAICTKCGSKVNSNDDDSKKETEQAYKTESVSSSTNSTGQNIDITNITEVLPITINI